MIEALRRLGAFRRRRTLVLGDAVYRVRRDRLVRIPDEFVHVRASGKHRKRWGRGENGRMDWERQRQVMREHSRSDRRRYSFYTKDVERKRREKADRWDLRLLMDEWWLCGWDRDDYWDWDDWDEARDCSWTDPGWSVTFIDLMR